LFRWLLFSKDAKKKTIATTTTIGRVIDTAEEEAEKYGSSGLVISHPDMITTAVPPAPPAIHTVSPPRHLEVISPSSPRQQQSSSFSSSSFFPVSSNTPIPLLTACDIYLSYCKNDSSVAPLIEQIAGQLQSMGFSVFCGCSTSPNSNQLKSEEILQLIDSCKCFLFFLTPDYQQQLLETPSSFNGDQTALRLEFHYALGLLSASQMVPVIVSEKMSKKQSWKGRLRSEFYQSKSVTVLAGDEKEVAVRCQELGNRIKTVLNSKK
jgi:hypothetical protein